MNITKELLNNIFNKNINDLCDFINKTTDSVLIHIIAANYNWDNGFDIPYCIINNKNCDVATALMIFELADGYTFFYEDNKHEYNEWYRFILDLRNRIENGLFLKNEIEYIPKLSNIDKYKLKKMHPEIDTIFLDGVLGNKIDIIYIGT